jgi:hypothetical protein
MTTLYSDSVALAADARLLLPTILRKDQALGRRFKRVCDEVPVRIAEAMSSTGRAKRSEYNTALELVREAQACIRAAASVGTLNGSDLAIEGQIEQLIERMVLSLRQAA